MSIFLNKTRKEKKINKTKKTLLEHSKAKAQRTEKQNWTKEQGQTTLLRRHNRSHGQ